MACRWAGREVLVRMGMRIVKRAVKAVREPAVRDIVKLCVCMVVLIAECWVEMLVLARGGSRVVLLVLEAARRPAV